MLREKEFHLGLKQLENDPFMEFVSEREKGSIVKGTVKKSKQNKQSWFLLRTLRHFLKLERLVLTGSMMQKCIVRW